MADIRNYLKEKEKRESDQENFKDKLRKHKLKGFLGVLLVAAVVGVVAGLVFLQYRNHIYTGYEIVSSIERETVSGARDIRLGNAILTYSKDGAHCTDQKGNVIWNQTYGIQDMLVSICGDVAAIAEYNGRNIYLQNSSKVLGEITTTMPIRDITVSADGRVTVVMADTDQALVNTYNVDGELIFNGKATMQDSGYPVSLGLSPNGELLAVSHIYLDAGVQKTNVAFYNFGAVGDNYNDRLVSAYTYTDMFVPVVKYMNNNMAFAVGDSRLMFYSDSQKPRQAAEYLYDREIQSVFYSKEYVGLVLRSDNAENLYKMDVYNSNAQLVGSYYFNIEYTDIFFEKNSFTVYNDSECLIMTLDGVVKYEGSFHNTVRLMLPASSAYKYQLVTNDSLDTIQMK